MLKILVRNEDSGLRDALAHALASWGFISVIADEANQVFPSAVLEMPDCILLDFVEPGDATLDILRELKANPATRDVPVIVLSSSNDPLHQRQCLAEGASYYFDQRWTLEELRERINLFLRSG